MNLKKLPPEVLKILHRIAKDPHKGLLPWFRDPRNMIELRDAAYPPPEPKPKRNRK